MEYEEIAIEVAGSMRHTRKIPCEPIQVRIWLQNEGGREVKRLGDVYIVCPRDGDIVLTARPSGRFGIEPTED